MDRGQPVQARTAIRPDVDTLMEEAAGWIVTVLSGVLRRAERVTLALAGGSTPKELYRRLSREELRSRVDWGRVDFLWGDERCVPLDHPASNYRMACDSLLLPLAVPAASVHRIRTELGPEGAASAYEGEIRRLLGEVEPPRLDLVLLGLGEDGHTASLFPGGEELAETNRLAVASRSPEPPHQRVTLTLPALNSARRVLFLVSGERKAAAVRRILGAKSGSSLPAALVAPAEGELVWMLDDAAAADLKGSPRS